MTNVIDAARLVAEDIRANVRFTADLSALLPILDAVVLGAERGREEAYCRAICIGNGDDPDDPTPKYGIPLWKFYANEARAAMALADAEAGWRSIETCLPLTPHAHWIVAWRRPDDGRVIVGEAYWSPDGDWWWAGKAGDNSILGSPLRPAPSHLMALPAPPSTRP